MTLLAMIPSHTLYLFCPCGHNEGVAVADLLEAGHRQWRVDDVVRRARCSRCGQKGKSEVRIVYKSPGDPMRGAATQQAKPPREWREAGDTNGDG